MKTPQFLFWSDEDRIKVTAALRKNEDGRRPRVYVDQERVHRLDDNGHVLEVVDGHFDRATRTGWVLAVDDTSRVTWTIEAGHASRDAVHAPQHSRTT